MLVASALTAGFVTLIRSGCGSDVWRVTVAASPSLAGALDDLAREWESQDPKVDGQCVGVSVSEVSSSDASRGLTGQWNEKTLDTEPIAWATDSQAWIDWVGGSEVTAGYFQADPVVLGESKPVLAVAESTAESLGWVGGEPPSWSDVLDAAAAGDLTMAAANPRTSTEGLVTMLNAVGDGEGGIDPSAMSRFGEAIDAGMSAENAETLVDEILASEDPALTGKAFTTLDFQVEDINLDAGLEEDPLIPITPAGSGFNAVSTYQVLDGTGWVSPGDGKVATQFGAFLESAEAQEELAGADLSPVDDAAAASISGETVHEAVRAWQALRRDLNVLFVVDRSTDGTAGGDVAGAELATVAATVEQLASTSQAGLWAFGDGATEDNWESLAPLAELSDDNRSEMASAISNLGDQALYEGGSPLFKAVTDAYTFMAEHAVEGADNVVVVLTAGGTDSVSSPSIDETVDDLADASGSLSEPVSVVTVGFDAADADNLTRIAEATQGWYIEAPADGGVLDQIRSMG
ncbi:VWA domain-containing protein [Glycomyces buryatensis]|uniref:VWA domain-containing protein n=1 Tax=Glycomyces buryatensis TaxID=2570927 RepID=UPI0014562ED2|nr:vWA domain-containing protein [Glycomyces buryatensis]